jgi:hypothetical protein
MCQYGEPTWSRRQADGEPKLLVVSFFEIGNSGDA